MKRKQTKRLIFYILMMAWPTVHFCIFTIGVNTNSILLTFKNYQYADGAYTWVGFDNFKRVLSDLSSMPHFRVALKNSLIAFFVGFIISWPLHLLSAFYIYKKLPLGETFKFILVLPGMISDIIIVVVFKYFVERAVPVIGELITGNEMQGLIENTKTTFVTILFYCWWSGFGGGILVYVASMKNISESVVEAAKLDGVTPIREFFSITLPQIYPLISILMLAAFTGIFSAQMNLFPFFGLNADSRLWTIGYYLYKTTLSSTLSEYPYLSAFGLMITIVLMPIVFGLRRLIRRFDPTTD